MLNTSGLHCDKKAKYVNHIKFQRELNKKNSAQQFELHNGTVLQFKRSGSKYFLILNFMKKNSIFCSINPPMY